VVLIRGLQHIQDQASDGLAIENSYDLPLRDRLDVSYPLFDSLKLQVILDESKNGHYNPYSYGLPTGGHNQPFAPVSFTGYEGCNLLIIFFHAYYIPAHVIAYRPSNTLPGGYNIQECRGSYFFYRTAFSTEGIEYEPLFYNEFVSPAADGQLWIDTTSCYQSRRAVHHFPTFDVDDKKWLVNLDFLPPTDEVQNIGDEPFGNGADYFEFTKPQVDTFRRGRAYQYNTAPNLTTFPLISTADMAAAIIEDIQEFFS
jgi:hypothetical protein